LKQFFSKTKIYLRKNFGDPLKTKKKILTWRKRATLWSKMRILVEKVVKYVGCGN